MSNKLEFTITCGCGARRLDAFQPQQTSDDPALCKACGSPWPQKEYSAFSTRELHELRDRYRAQVTNERRYLDPNPGTRKGGREPSAFGDVFLVEAEERLDEIEQALLSRDENL